MGLIENTPVPISQYEKEFEFLLRIYEDRQPQRILEIGTHHGGTLYYWLQKANSFAFISAVNNQHINSQLYFDWSEGAGIDWFTGDSTSQEAWNWMKDGAPYDFIFIDGDHSYEGVLNDYQAAVRLIARPGIIAFHDITPHPNRQVDLLWEDLKLLGGWEEVIDMSYAEDERCGIGIIYLD